MKENNDVDAEKFYDYYSSNGWKVGKNCNEGLEGICKNLGKEYYPNNKKYHNLNKY